jgi:ATP-dependent DNA ligase
VSWHRVGFRRYWRWKSRSLGGRPSFSAELQALIRRMSLENTLWGALHIHWVEPRFDAEIAYAEITDDGMVRHPSFKRLVP